MKPETQTTKGVCRKCGCTWDNPCYHPDYDYCWWVDDTATLCSHCADPDIEKESEHCVNYKMNDEREQK